MATSLQRLHQNFISQLISYSRAFQKYEEFVFHVTLLTLRLMWEDCVVTRLKSCLEKFYGGNHDLNDKNRFVHCVIVIVFRFVYPGRDIWYAIHRVFLENWGRLPHQYTWSMFLAHINFLLFLSLRVLLIIASSFWMCLFSKRSLHSRNKFFWVSLESSFLWVIQLHFADNWRIMINLLRSLRENYGIIQILNGVIKHIKH